MSDASPAAPIGDDTALAIRGLVKDVYKRQGCGLGSVTRRVGAGDEPDRSDIKMRLFLVNP